MMVRFLSACLLALVSFQATAASTAAEGERLDLLIEGGTIIDGSGEGRYVADVGILGDTIVAIGPELAESHVATRIIDARGKVVAPGYIDVHTHAGRVVLGDDRKRKAALNLLYQGITTIDIGADGRHSRKYGRTRNGQIRKQYDYIDSHPFGMNVFILMGHDNIRKWVMGDDDFKRFSTREETAEMAEMVRQYMEEGALGMSLGLEYASGRWSDAEELVYLAKSLAEYDRRSVIVAHERATGPQHRYYYPSRHDARGLYGDRFRKYPQGWDLIDYIKEGIRIAEESGVVYDFSHLKVTHRPYWGKSDEVVDLINDARARGVKVFAEHIAFLISGNSPMNLPLIPTKYFDGTKYSYAKLERALANPRKASELRADIAWLIAKQGGADVIDVIQCRSQPQLVGKTLAEIMESWGMDDPVDAILRIKEIGDDKLRTGARFRARQTLSAYDVSNFARQDWMGTVTDAGIYGTEGGFAQPRVFASFTNKITQFVHNLEVISLEHAVRAGTSLPATMLSIPDRGLLEVGYKADIQIFDEDELAVNARWTLRNSRAYSDGMYYVMVNGVLTLDDRKPTFELPGRSIRNQDIWLD